MAKSAPRFSTVHNSGKFLLRRNPMAAAVHAANIHDTKAGILAAKKAFEAYPSIQRFCADAGYRKTFEQDVSRELGLGVDISVRIKPEWEVLPMPEESGEPFACPTGTEAHACGHDFHAAMLLTAAKILKENESLLSGKVRFMFQTAEETFEGAKDMLAGGILDGVDGALAYHVGAGRMPVGLFMYNAGGTMMYSVDGFRITVHGRGAHGAYPHSAIDPINIAVHIYLALEALIAREADPGKACVLTIGNFAAGSAPNIIPDTAVLQGTLRTNDSASREKLVRRLREVSQKTAEVYGGTAEIEALSQVPPLVCDAAMTEEMVRYMQELPIPGLTPVPDTSASASEDFAATVTSWTLAAVASTVWTKPLPASTPVWH